MDPAHRARLEAGAGLVGNADQGGRRQVTIIDQDAWDQAERELGATVDPSLRRANLLVTGVSLGESRGRVLRIGGCRIRLLGETRPCHLMDQAHPGLQAALSPAWRGGAFGEVLDDGEIAIGEVAVWEKPEQT